MVGLRSKPENLIVEVDKEAMEGLRSMAEAVVFTERDDFIEKVCSILLMGFVLKGHADVTIDAFERILSMVTMKKGYTADKLWGEFLLLRKHFLRKHEDQNLIRDSLEDLISHYELRVFPEEIFRISISPQGSTILVS